MRKLEEQMNQAIRGQRNWAGSNTTKSRLNALLSEFKPQFGVFQKNWTWYVSDRLRQAVMPFNDGFTFKTLN